MTTPRIVYLLNFGDSVPDELERSVARARAAGFEVDVRETPRTLSEDEVAAILPGYVACVTSNHHFSKKAIDAAPGLKVIARTGAGFELIDLAYCSQKGVVVTNASGSNARAVAEFALALILAVARRLTLGERVIRGGGWRAGTSLSGHSIVGKTLGIIGFGHIGQELARLVSGFRMRVLYYDVRRQEELEATGLARFAEVDEILRTADLVSVHVALNAHTKHMIGRRELSLMKRSAYLVNTSRGGVIDEEALFEALSTGVIAGAALDVFESEPVRSDHKLLTLTERFVCTPHIGGLSLEAEAEMLKFATDCLLSVLDGGRPAAVLNPDAFVISRGRTHEELEPMG